MAPGAAMSELPWNAALLDANRAQAQRLVEAEAEVVKLKAERAELRRKLYLARQRQSNWLIRQRTWREERQELLRRLVLSSDLDLARRET